MDFGRVRRRYFVVSIVCGESHTSRLPNNYYSVAVVGRQILYSILYNSNNNDERAVSPVILVVVAVAVTVAFGIQVYVVNRYNTCAVDVCTKVVVVVDPVTI